MRCGSASETHEYNSWQLAIPVFITLLITRNQIIASSSGLSCSTKASRILYPPENRHEKLLHTVILKNVFWPSLFKGIHGSMPLTPSSFMRKQKGKFLAHIPYYPALSFLDRFPLLVAKTGPLYCKMCDMLYKEKVNLYMISFWLEVKKKDHQYFANLFYLSILNKMMTIWTIRWKYLL